MVTQDRDQSTDKGIVTGLAWRVTVKSPSHVGVETAAYTVRFHV